jgi:uncharacterized protein (DUF4415 family)
MSDKYRNEVEIDEESILAETGDERRERLRTLASTKERITIRIDSDILAQFRQLAHEGGGSYQTLINRALGEWLLGDRFERAIEQLREEMETTLRNGMVSDPP